MPFVDTGAVIAWGGWERRGVGLTAPAGFLN